MRTDKSHGQILYEVFWARQNVELPVPWEKQPLDIQGVWERKATEYDRLSSLDKRDKIKQGDTP